jgi:hypothetical protein
MPVDYKKYPANWPEISRRIRERSGGRCECEGECGLHRTNPGPRRCVEINATPALWANGSIVLTVAHLHDSNPQNCSDDNLKAMCQRCHLRFDSKLHVLHSSETRRLKFLERQPLLPNLIS